MHRFNSKKILVLCSFIILLIVSCKNDYTKKEASDNPAEISGLTGGTLRILYTDSATFNKFKSKMIFSFVFRTQNALTLAGWDYKVPYSPAPEIELKRGRVTAATYSTGTYFGNLFLSKDEVETINADILDKYEYILFTPDNTIQDHIKYKITYTNTDPKTLEEAGASAAPAAAIYANPSPPKNHN